MVCNICFGEGIKFHIIWGDGIYVLIAMLAGWRSIKDFITRFISDLGGDFQVKVSTISRWFGDQKQRNYRMMVEINGLTERCAERTNVRTPSTLIWKVKKFQVRILNETWVAEVLECEWLCILYVYLYYYVTSTTIWYSTYSEQWEWTSHSALRENVQNYLNPQNKFNFHIEKQKTVDDSLLLYILNTSFDNTRDTADDSFKHKTSGSKINADSLRTHMLYMENALFIWHPL